MNHFEDLTEFQTLQSSVVSRCSTRTRDAIEQNEDIKEAAERRRVMKEILDETINYLEGIFGTETPSMIQLLLIQLCIICFYL